MKRKILMMLPISILMLSSCSIFEGLITTKNTENIPTTTVSTTKNTTTTVDPATTTSRVEPATTTTITTSTSTTQLVNVDTALYYDDLFDLNNNVELSISISNSELKKINDDYMCNTYRMTDLLKVKITYPNGNVLESEIDEVGIRMKGNTSRRSFLNGNDIENNVSYKLSFDETFDDEEEYKLSERKVWTDSNARKLRKDRTFFSLGGLEIKFNREGDASYSRDIYASKVYRENGVMAQNVTLGEVKFVNQTSYSGVDTLYKIYEPVDKYFVHRYFEGNDDGDLYKATYGNVSGMPTLNQTSDDAYGVDTTLYKGEQSMSYDLKTNKKKSKHQMMKSFLEWINSSETDLSSTISDYMNPDYFYTFMAIQYMSGDWDNFLYDSNNYYLYFGNDGLAYFIPYDMDRCFGIQAKNYDMVNKRYTDSWNLQGDNNKSNLLLKTIFKSGSVSQKAYQDKIKAIASNVLDNKSFENNVYNYIFNNYGYTGNINKGNAPAEFNNAPKSYFEQKLALIG